MIENGLQAMWISFLASFTVKAAYRASDIGVPVTPLAKAAVKRGTLG
jgi:hypothetical protein